MEPAPHVSTFVHKMQFREACLLILCLLMQVMKHSGATLSLVVELVLPWSQSAVVKSAVWISILEWPIQLSWPVLRLF